MDKIKNAPSPGQPQTISPGGLRLLDRMNPTHLLLTTLNQSINQSIYWLSGWLTWACEKRILGLRLKRCFVWAGVVAATWVRDVTAVVSLPVVPVSLTVRDGRPPTLSLWWRVVFVFWSFTAMSPPTSPSDARTVYSIYSTTFCETLITRAGSETVWDGMTCRHFLGQPQTIPPLIFCHAANIHSEP